MTESKDGILREVALGTSAVRSFLGSSATCALLLVTMGCGESTTGSSNSPEAGAFEGSTADEGGASNEERGAVGDAADRAATVDQTTPVVSDAAADDTSVDKADGAAAPSDAAPVALDATTRDAANDANVCPAQVPQPTIYPYTPFACPQAAGFPGLVCSYPTAPCPNRYSCQCASGQGGPATCVWILSTLCTDAGDAS